MDNRSYLGSQQPLIVHREWVQSPEFLSANLNFSDRTSRSEFWQSKIGMNGTIEMWALERLSSTVDFAFIFGPGEPATEFEVFIKSRMRHWLNRKVECIIDFVYMSCLDCDAATDQKLSFLDNWTLMVSTT
jgi:hypothetical protein